MAHREDAANHFVAENDSSPVVGVGAQHVHQHLEREKQQFVVDENSNVLDPLRIDMLVRQDAWRN